MTRTMPKTRRLGAGRTNQLMRSGRTCTVEEKVDGSLVCWTWNELTGLEVWGSRHQIDVADPSDTYKGVVRFIEGLAAKGLLRPSWTYWAEVIDSPRPRTLGYDRPARNGLVLWDVQRQSGDYLGEFEKEIVAKSLDVDCAPVLHRGPLTLHLLATLVETSEPLLGGDRVEGVVIKDADDISAERLVAKYVADEFLESHLGEEFKLPDDRRALVSSLVGAVVTVPRMEKMRMAMADDGVLSNTPRDIGELCRRVREDIRAEELPEMHRQLEQYWEVRPSISPGDNDAIIEAALKACNAPVALWYKDWLAERQT